MVLCPNCNLWDPRPEDVYCSWCGQRLISLHAELRRKHFSLNEVPPPVDLVLSNEADAVSIVVESIEPSEPWIRINTGGNKLPVELAPRTTRTFTFRIETIGLAPGFHSGSIRVRTNVGEEKLALEVVPEPKLSISAYSGNQHRENCRFDVLLDNRNLECNLIRIAAVQGSIVIERITNDQPEWLTVRLPSGCSLPVTLDARKSAYLDVFVDVNEQVLERKNAALPAEYTANLTIGGEDEFVHQETLTFECMRPPTLWIWEEDAYTADAWPGETGLIELTLQNSMPGNPRTGKGNAPLQVSQIEIQDADGNPCTWLKPSGEFSLPITIKGGAYQQVKFAFETDAEGKNSADKLGWGRHAAIVILTTNLAVVTHKVRFEVEVHPIRDFSGVLAIDFGTSNTCCAILRDSDQSVNLIQIDNPSHNTNPSTAPTVIQYLDRFANDEVSVKIGAEIEARESSARMIRSTARSLKRFLGSGELFEIHFYNSPDVVERYSARRVVGDYLREVRRAAERHERGVRFRNIAITHPSRFKLRQIMELEEAVRLAFGDDCKIDVLPEPVAAALGFLLDPEALAKDRYVIGVFDFGGGTTDLSLIEVVNDRREGFTEVRPRQLGSGGRWFGGEDLTRFVFEQGLKRCQEIAAKDYPGQVLINLDLKTITDGNQRRLAIENSGRLSQWAEYSKLLLFQHGDDHSLQLPLKPGLFPEVKLSLWGESGSTEQSFRHDQIVPKRADLDKLLSTRVKELATDLAKLVALSHVGNLDYIRLSGKSSTIPLVSEVLAKEFPGAELRPASEPKQCVVEGACIKYQADFAINAFPIFEQSDFVQTTSRIGIEDVRAHRFVELIGVGVPVSDDGLIGHYERFPLRAGARVRLLENASIADNIMPSKDISLIATFRVDPTYTGSPKQRVVPARLELRLSPDLTPTLVATVPDAKPVSFFMEGELTTQGGAG